jgi:hypothetical protein
MYRSKKNITTNDLEAFLKNDDLCIIKLDNRLIIEANSKFEELGEDVSRISGKLTSYHKCEISLFFENGETNIYAQYYTKNYIKALVILVWVAFTSAIIVDIMKGDLVSIVIFLIVSIISILNLVYRIRSFKSKIENILFSIDFVKV